MTRKKSRAERCTSKIGSIHLQRRLQKSRMNFNLKHPGILPKDSDVTKALVRFHHEKTYHSGKGITVNEIRDNGLWINSVNSVVRHVLHNCVIYRHIRGIIIQQKMCDLPSNRIEASPPFTYAGVDLFNPFNIKVRRSTVKRYGVMFTCLTS